MSRGWRAGLTDSLTYDFEQQYCRCRRDVERLDLADHRDRQLFVAELQHLFRNARILGAHNECRRLAEIRVVEQLAAFFRSTYHLVAFCLERFERVADRTDAADGNGGQCTRRRTNRLRIDGSGILQRYDQSVRSGTFGRAGDGSEVTHVRHAVEEDDQRRLVFGHPFQNVVQFDVADGGDLGDDALVVAAREAVELLDGNLLCADAMPQAEVARSVINCPSAPLRM